MLERATTHDNAPGEAARRWADLDAAERRRVLGGIVAAFADREPEPEQRRRPAPPGWAGLTERERQARHAEILAGLRGRAIQRADAGVDDPATDADVARLMEGTRR